MNYLGFVASTDSTLRRHRSVVASQGQCLLATRGALQGLLLADTIAVACDTALGDRLRFGLTSLGMLIGTVSLVLVNTFSLAGKDYVLQEIRSLGSNWISAEHPVVGGKSNAWSDNLTLDDMEAVRRNVSGILAASPVLPPLVERVELGGGKVRTVQVMGASRARRVSRDRRAYAHHGFGKIEKRSGTGGEAHLSRRSRRTPLCDGPQESPRHGEPDWRLR